ncbi:MAG: TIM44-like domain-containing protein [Verrucomicrobiota bacterium]
MQPPTDRARPVAILATGIWLTLGLLTRLAARAGGAGGGSSSSHSSGGGSSSSHSSGSGGFSVHSSSGSGGSSGSSVFSLFCFLIFLGIAGLILYLTLRNMKSWSTGTPGTPPPLPDGEDEGLAAFFAANPDFQLDAFRQKVSDAFLKIQAAWSAQSLAEVRPFISDGIYQRFATQFHMMALLQQQNRLENVRIFDISPVAASRDGEYDVLQVRISAAMNDAFVCQLDHSLDTDGHEAFAEYWSFIRKRVATKPGGDIYQNQGCPSCGAPLPPDMGELCRCTYCQVMVNSGEFDWVLAEITQEADYGRDSRWAGSAAPQLPQALAELTAEAPDLAVQLIEDKASNAFMQIMTALATRNPAVVRRFVSDDALAAVTALIPQQDIIFNRLYLNEAVLFDAARVDGRHQLRVGLTATLQRVQLAPKRGFTPVDPEEIRAGYVVTLERDAAAVPTKGALYQHQCPNCAGAVGDTLDLNCQYCGVPLNSMHNEWIVTRFEENGAL